MGSSKPLLDWFGEPLIQRQARALLEGGVDEVYAVTGNRAEEVEAVLHGDAIHAVRNPAHRDGKTTSVKAGLAALPPDVSAVVLLAVDQPRPAWLIRKVLEAHRASGALISSPAFHGRGGHPIVFDGSLREELAAITEECQGVRQVVRAHSDSVNRVELGTPLARLDMNTAEDADAARRLFPDPRTA